MLSGSKYRFRQLSPCLGYAVIEDTDAGGAGFDVSYRMVDLDDGGTEQFIKGRLDPGESVLEGAQRELKEEIGLGAKKLMQLTSLSLAPGYMTHVTHVVLARDLYPEKLQGDEPEELEIVPWPLDDLHSLVQRPDCTEGRSIAALYIARDHLQQETTDVE